MSHATFDPRQQRSPIHGKAKFDQTSLTIGAADHITGQWVILTPTNHGAEVYRDPRRYWELYELAEKLVDFEDYFRRWRFNHVTTVERIIGFKRGSGGTSGVNYLRKMLDVVLFPDLWELRTEL